MRLRTRLAKLERHSAPAGADEQGPAVELWLPYNGRCDPPGRYPCPGSNAILVIYDPDEMAGGEAQRRPRRSAAP